MRKSLAVVVLFCQLIFITSCGHFSSRYEVSDSESSGDSWGVLFTQDNWEGALAFAKVFQDKQLSVGILGGVGYGSLVSALFAQDLSQNSLDWFSYKYFQKMRPSLFSKPNRKEVYEGLMTSSSSVRAARLDSFKKKWVCVSFRGREFYLEDSGQLLSALRKCLGYASGYERGRLGISVLLEKFYQAGVGKVLIVHSSLGDAQYDAFIRSFQSDKVRVLVLNDFKVRTWSEQRAKVQKFYKQLHQALSLDKSS